jgi:hypothetical protein
MSTMIVTEVAYIRTCACSGCFAIIFSPGGEQFPIITKRCGRKKVISLVKRGGITHENAQFLIEQINGLELAEHLKIMPANNEMPEAVIEEVIGTLDHKLRLVKDEEEELVDVH